MPHAPMRLVAARVLNGASGGAPLLPLVAEAEDSRDQRQQLQDL